MEKIKIGDVFELKTPHGNAYLHYIHHDSTIGELIRVLPGLYKERPTNFNELATLKERYMVSFPLTAAMRKKIVVQIAFYPAGNFSKPQFMREPHNIRGEFLGWNIVNTYNWHRQLIKDLNSDQKKLSPWGIWNDTLLIENLKNDWSLENWEA